MNEEPKLWRLDFRVLQKSPYVKYEFKLPTEVRSGNKIVGYANVYLTDDYVRATIAVDYALPERLDWENGEKIYAIPFVHVQFATLTSKNSNTIIEIKYLELRKDCNHPEELGEIAAMVDE